MHSHSDVLHSPMPSRGLILYKYMPERYVKRFVDEGRLLFRNLTSFKRMEDAARKDVSEGCHVDNPDNDVILENITTKKRFVGRFSMRTSINSDKVFVFCMSKTYGDELFDRFGCDACVCINDFSEFIRRCHRAIKRLVFVDSLGCLYGDVEYYSINRASTHRSIEKPTDIPFLKHSVFREQDEYRIVFGRKGAFKIAKRIIVDQDWDTKPDHLSGTSREVFLSLGSIADIVSVRRSSR